MSRRYSDMRRIHSLDYTKQMNETPMHHRVSGYQRIRPYFYQYYLVYSYSLLQLGKLSNSSCAWFFVCISSGLPAVKVEFYHSPVLPSPVRSPPGSDVSTLPKFLAIKQHYRPMIAKNWVFFPFSLFVKKLTLFFKDILKLF